MGTLRDHPFQISYGPADEARKLALALGLDVEADLVKGKQVVRKKGGSVVLQRPAQRQCRGLVDPDAVIFDIWLDAAHTAMLIYDEDGAAACEAFLKRAGLLTGATFKDVLQTMINAIPRTQVEGEFVRPEAATLDKLRLALFEDLTVPAEDEPPVQVEQLDLFGDGDGGRIPRRDVP